MTNIMSYLSPFHSQKLLLILRVVINCFIYIFNRLIFSFLVSIILCGFIQFKVLDQYIGQILVVIILCNLQCLQAHFLENVAVYHMKFCIFWFWTQQVQFFDLLNLLGLGRLFILSLLLEPLGYWILIIDFQETSFRCELKANLVDDD